MTQKHSWHHVYKIILVTGSSSVVALVYVAIQGFSLSNILFKRWWRSILRSLWLLPTQSTRGGKKMQKMEDIYVDQTWEFYISHALLFNLLFVSQKKSLVLWSNLIEWVTRKMWSNCCLGEGEGRFWCTASRLCHTCALFINSRTSL